MEKEERKFTQIIEKISIIEFILASKWLIAFNLESGSLTYEIDYWNDTSQK